MEQHLYKPRYLLHEQFTSITTALYDLYDLVDISARFTYGSECVERQMDSVESIH